MPFKINFKNFYCFQIALYLFLGSCTPNQSSKKLVQDQSITKSNQQNSTKNSELKIGISQEFENFNPLISTMAATTYMLRMTNRTLVVIDETGHWTPQLAIEIPSFENGQAQIVKINGQKKTKVLWQIKPEARWGDGTPVTCKDFILAIKVATSTNVSVGEKETYGQIEKIDFDPQNLKKCTFLYTKAKWDFYHLANFYALPAHLEEPIFKKFGHLKEGYEKNTLYNKAPTHPGLFNGPFVISEIQLGDHVSFQPNPMFYGSQPKLNRITVKLILNTNELEGQLKSGSIHVVSTVGFALDQALSFDKKIKEENLNFKILYQPSAIFEHIDLNLDNPLLKDIRVRKALNYALNKDDLVRALFEGKQKTAVHNINPNDPWYTEDPKIISTYPYDKKEAEKLLESAGWKLGSDGIRTKNNKKLSFKLMTTTGNKTRELVQVYLQNQWKQVGVEIILENEPARIFFGETTQKRNFEAMALFAWTRSPESNSKSLYTSKNIPTKKNGYSGQNFSGWKNQKVDQILESLDLEMSGEKRKELMHSFLKIYTDELPQIPLFYRADVAVIPQNLKGFNLTGHQFPETNKVENWSLE